MTLDRFPKESFVLLDGAMGTMLQQKGLKPGEQPELIALTHPEWLKDIHGAYVAAGTRIVYTDTFGANREKLGPTGRNPEEVIPAAVRAARAAASAAWPSAWLTTTASKPPSASSTAAKKHAARRRDR